MLQITRYAKCRKARLHTVAGNMFFVNIAVTRISRQDSIFNLQFTTFGLLTSQMNEAVNVIVNRICDIASAIEITPSRIPLVH